jgi:hypothetical protein
MNFFKKALIATAVAGTFGAVQAADVTNAISKTSTQGVEIGSLTGTPSVRAIVRELLEAGDTVTLKFGKDMFTTAPISVLFGTADQIGTTPPATTELGISYGSGTFTFGQETISTTDGVTTVTFQVLTGDPMPKDASFEVLVVGGDLDATKTADANVAYSAVSGLTGDAKDTTGTNMGSFITLADQYAASVTTPLNGVIERENQITFVSGGVDGATVVGVKDADTLVIKLEDNTTFLSAALGTDVTATVTVKGDFTTSSITQAAVTDGTATVGTLALNGNKDELEFTVVPVASDGIQGNVTITLDNVTEVIKAGDYTVSVSVDAAAVTTNTVFTALDDADAGTWAVDATIINVPYLVVGKEGTDSAVHFSNLGPAADVIVSAVSVIDADGDSVTYAATDLGLDLAANSVTKVKQKDIIDALSIPAGTQKLSVTFNIKGEADDVSAYAFIKDESGRTEVSNSQQLNK